MQVNMGAKVGKNIFFFKMLLMKFYARLFSNCVGV